MKKVILILAIVMTSVSCGNAQKKEFSKDALKGIIFGDNIEEDNRSTIIHLINNDKSYNINYWSAKKNLYKKTLSILI